MIAQEGVYFRVSTLVFLRKKEVAHAGQPLFIYYLSLKLYNERGGAIKTAPAPQRSR